MSPKDKRSPLKEKPLRYPGEYLDEQILDLRDKIFPYVAYCAVMIFFIGDQWFRWIRKIPLSNPLPATILLVFVLIFCIFKIRKFYLEIVQLRMARDGEMIVGQSLEELRTLGAVVFHDVPGEKFNVDHLVVAPQGIYAVETKTISKPLKGDARVKLDGKRLLINGREMDRNPLEQAKALARWVSELLAKSTGKRFSVKPVVLFPGWYVEPIKGEEEVWVLNHKALAAFIKNEKQKISDEDLHLAAFHLTRYIQAKRG